MLQSSVVLFLIGTASSIVVGNPLRGGLLTNVRGLEEDASVYSWMINYSLKFTSCHTVTEYNVDNDGAGYVYKQKLIEFKICPTGTCDSACEGGDYLVPLEDYATAYAEQQVIDKAYACAQAKQSCACDEKEDRALEEEEEKEEEEEGDEEEEEEESEEEEEEEDCEETCYQSAGLDYCIGQESDEGSGEGDDGNEELDMEDYIQCQEFDMNDDGSDQYYIGLKCSKDGQGVNVGIFTDNYCSVEKSDDVYLPAAEYLPYQEETMISNDCISCEQVEYYDNGNGEEEGEEEEDNDDNSNGVSEMCLVNYAESAKCEENGDMYYPNTDGCELISRLYLREDDYEPEDTSSMRLSIRFLMLLSVIFFAVTFRLCYIAQKQQRRLREDEIKWRNGNRLY